MAFGLFVAADLAIQRFVVLPRFVELERNHARTDIERAQESIEREVEHLVHLCQDWACWDDAYNQVLNEDDPAVAARLHAATLKESQIELLFVLDDTGRPRLGLCVDVVERSALDLPLLHHDKFPSDHPFLLAGDDGTANAGVVQTAVGPLLFAARSVPNSSSNEPTRGRVIMGRFLSEDRVQQIAERTRARFSLHPIDGTNLPDSARPTFAALERRPFDVVVAEPSGPNLTALTYLRDINGNPIQLLRVEVDGDITAQGVVAVRLALAALVIVGAITLGVMMVFLQKIVIGPVVRLTNGATHIGATGDLTRSVAISRTDEIGVLSREVDAMVQNLAESRRAFMDAAREAGMAEVASGVLHNVGNVLNSLNVSADVLVNGAKHSELVRIEELAQLLRTHENDLSAFLAAEGRAKHLREFVEQLSSQRRLESNARLSELSRLRSNLDHVAHVIGSQQAMVRGTALNEPVALSALTRDVVKLVDPTYRRHQIDLVVKVDALPTITLDRVRLVQVLVNILTNAKDAVKSQARDARRVELTVRRVKPNADQQDDGVIRIEITDNGIGVDAETLPFLFTQGFTTKESGSGIGLHFCAVAVKCMNGTISALSEGPGHGTTFRIDLRLPASEDAQHEDSGAERDAVMESRGESVHV